MADKLNFKLQTTMRRKSLSESLAKETSAKHAKTLLAQMILASSLRD